MSYFELLVVWPGGGDNGGSGPALGFGKNRRLRGVQESEAERGDGEYTPLSLRIPGALSQDRQPAAVQPSQSASQSERQ